MILYFAISYLVYEKPMYAQQAVANRKIDRQKMQIQYVGFLKMHAVKEVTPSPPTTATVHIQDEITSSLPSLCGHKLSTFNACTSEL